MKKIVVIWWIASLVVWTWMLFSNADFISSNWTFSSQTPNVNGIEIKSENKNLKTAYVAGGCFWCIESIFDGTEGVEEAISGYIGGAAETANYASIGGGGTQHREWVEVIYDANRINFEEIVNIFWRQIDPTDAGWQFADRGFHYTTAIYYSNNEEKLIAENSKNILASSGKFEEEIATKILPVSDFYKAEEWHQDYAQKQTLRYKAYEIWSWRAGYKNDVWKNDTTLPDADTKKSLFTDVELREKLTALQYRVTQQDGTERAFTEWNYHDSKEAWIYVDIVDGTPLYSSTHKYDSGTGWPSFWQSINDENIFYKEDNSFFSKRTEVRSTQADSHLGHVFPDGPRDKWGIRHCINWASLEFIPYEELENRGYWEYISLF